MKPRIQNLAALREEMKAVARGQRGAPRHAGKVGFNSTEAVARLLSTENRRLLALIRDKQPSSIAELSLLSGRAEPNLNRTLEKMAAAGFVVMKPMGRKRRPTIAVRRIVVEIDPFSDNDKLEIA